MVNINSEFIPGIDIITQIGMIEPVIARASSIPGVFSKEIEIVGSFGRKTSYKGNKSCIDLMIPVNSQDTGKKLLAHFTSVPSIVKNKGYMLKIMIGWGWVGIIPAVYTNIKNYYNFFDYKKDYNFMSNIIMQMNYIMNFGKNELIKNIKMEIQREEIEINSFVLELAIIEALKDFQNNDQKEQYKKVMEYFTDEFPRAELVDPSNNGNIISKDIKGYIRERLRTFAIKALKNI